MHVNVWQLAMINVAYLWAFLVTVVLNVEFAVRLIDASNAPATDNDEMSRSSTTTSVGDLGLSRNVSWWAESVSLALGDVATRALRHDQLQQLYDNSVCMTSLTPDDVNISQHVLDAAAMFS